MRRNTNLFSSSAQRVNALVNDREFLRGERGGRGGAVETGRQSECDGFAVRAVDFKNVITKVFVSMSRVLISN